MGLIRITLKKGGNVKVEAIGYAPGTCKAATRPYEDALNGVKTVQDKTEEQIAAEVDAVAPAQETVRA